MFEEITMEHRAVAFRTRSKNFIFSQRNMFVYIKLVDATHRIWKFSDI